MSAPTDVWRDRFVELFDAHFHRLFRYLDRLSDDADLAADLAQDAFIRLYRRGSEPDAPEAWLISVAMNLFRNARATAARRRRLLTIVRAGHAHSDAAPSPLACTAASETRQRVRVALDALPERDRHLLLLDAEGYSHRAVALALNLNEASVGTLLARSKQRFRQACAESHHAP